MQAGFDPHRRRGGLEGAAELGRVQAPGQDDLEQHGVDGLVVLTDHPGVHVGDVDAIVRQQGRDPVHDPGVVGPVDGDDVRVPVHHDRSTFARRAHLHGQLGAPLVPRQFRLEGLRGQVVGPLHLHHHGELPGQHRHRAVLQVAAHAEQHTGHCSHDAGTVGADRPHREFVRHGRLLEISNRTARPRQPLI